MISFIDVDFASSDARGCLVQLCRDGWKQVNVSKSYAGTVRGNHFHKRNREAFFIVEGGIEMTLERNGETQKVNAQKGDFFIIEPDVCHSFRYPEDTLTVALYDLGVENPDGSKDIYSR